MNHKASIVYAGIFTLVFSYESAQAQLIHIGRPPVLCRLPRRDYQYYTQAMPLRQVSRIAIMSEHLEGLRTDIKPTSVNTKLFQFTDDPVMRIDHCFISRVCVTLDEHGKWSVALVADQNPAEARYTNYLREITTKEEPILFTEHLRRSQFFVTIKFLGTDQAAEINGLLGHPVISAIRLDPFWVQRALPRDILESGYDENADRLFEAINRVEVIFGYRNEPVRHE